MKKTNSLERHRAKILMLVGILVVVFLSNFGSALLSTKYNIEVEQNAVYSVGEKVLEYNTIWETYQPVEIRDFLGLTEVKFSGAITEHTDYCSDNCKSEMNVYLADDGVLIKDLQFYEIKGDDRISTKINHNIYISNIEEQVLVDDYDVICKDEISQNGTIMENCNLGIVGNHYENKPMWLKYNLGDEVKAGNYLIKIDGDIGTSEYHNQRTYDWVITTGFGNKELEEWATWTSNTSIVLGFAEIGGGTGYPRMTTFNLSTTYYTISCRNDGLFYGYVWNGTGWMANTTIVGGLLDVGSTGDCDTFYVDGSTNILIGSASTGYWGYTWSGSTWVKNLTINNSLTACSGGSCSVSLFLKDGSWYLISGNQDGNFEGWVWNGGGWTSYPAIVSGLTDAGVSARGEAFYSYNSSAWYFIDMCEAGTVRGWTWNTNVWASNTTILDGLGSDYDYGKVDTYKKDNTLNLIIGYEDSPYTVGFSMNDTAPASPLNPPTITLNSPANAYKTNNTNVTLNWTITPTTANITNYTLNIYYLNGTLAHTHATLGNLGSSALTVIHNDILLPDNNYTWGVIVGANNSGGDKFSASSSNRTFQIHTTNPTITIINPSGNYNLGYVNLSVPFNYTATDPEIDKCWYNYNGSSNFINCSANYTTITLREGKYNLTLYANDTFGNSNSAFTSWSYGIFSNSETYSTSVLEGSTPSFTINLTTNGTDLNYAYLVYNGTSSLGSLTQSGDNYIITASKIAPTVSTDTNLTFYWSVTQGTNTITTTSHNQTVLDLGLDNCSVNTAKLYTFSIYDEKTLALLNATGDNTIGDLNLQVYTSNRATNLINFSYKYNQTNPFSVCLSDNLTTETYSLDLQLQYYADDYSKEFYNIKNSSITISSLNTAIGLYDLDNTTAQPFKLTYKDAYFLPVGGVLVQVSRKYIDEGIFRTVELPETDSSGQTLLHLETGNVIYTFNFIKNGVILDTYSNFLANCQSTVLGECTININSFSSNVQVPDYTTGDDFTFTLTYNRTTRLVSSTFVIPSGGVSSVSLNVSSTDALGTTGCSQQVVSSSGTLTCTVPLSLGNSSVVAYLYKDGAKMGGGTLSLAKSNRDIYGNSVVFLVLFLYLTLIGVAVSDNPMVTGGALILGVVLAVALNMVNATGFFGVGATILWFVIAVGIVLIKGSKRQ